jgi:hypothetical protein
VVCPSYDICENWAKYQKNVSILLDDKAADDNYAQGEYVGENSDSLLCRLEDGVVFNTGLSMIMFHADPLLRRVNEIIDGVVVAGTYNYWSPHNSKIFKSFSRKIAMVHPLDGHHNFNLYHTKPAFYVLLIGLCLSALIRVVVKLCIKQKNVKLIMSQFYVIFINFLVYSAMLHPQPGSLFTCQLLCI